jgi:hypothetical protein
MELRTVPCTWYSRQAKPTAAAIATGVGRRGGGGGSSQAAEACSSRCRRAAKPVTARWPVRAGWVGGGFLATLCLYDRFTYKNSRHG